MFPPQFHQVLFFLIFVRVLAYRLSLFPSHCYNLKIASIICCVGFLARSKDQVSG